MLILLIFYRVLPWTWFWVCYYLSLWNSNMCLAQVELCIIFMWLYDSMCPVRASMQRVWKNHPKFLANCWYEQMTGWWEVFTSLSVSVHLFSFLSFFLSFFFFWWGAHLWRMEVPWLVWEPAAANLHHSHGKMGSDLHHSSCQCWILNPLSKARDQTLDTSRLLHLLSHNRNSLCIYFLIQVFRGVRNSWCEISEELQRKC